MGSDLRTAVGRDDHFGGVTGLFLYNIACTPIGFVVTVGMAPPPARARCMRGRARRIGQRVLAIRGV